MGKEDPAPPPKHVLVKVQDGCVVVAGPAPPPHDEPWVEGPDERFGGPLPGGYILATPAERYTSAELFNWSKYISPPRGWPEAFTYFKPMKDFLSKRLKAQRVRLIEAPHPLELERLEGTLGHQLVRDDALANAVAVRRLLGWPIVAGYMLLEEGQGCGRKDPVTCALYHGEKHWWNATQRGMWLDFSPRRHKKLVLVESAKVAAPEPTEAERDAMKKPAERADEMIVDFVVGGLELPGIRLTAKQLDGGQTFLAACLEAVDKPYKAAQLKRRNAEDGGSGGGGGGGDGSSDDDDGAPQGIDRTTLRSVTIDGKPVQAATSTPPRQLLTRPGRRVEFELFSGTLSQRFVHFFRLFNLHLIRLLEAPTLCFSRIGRLAPPVVLTEWQTLAAIIEQYGPLSLARELHVDGHGTHFGESALALLTPLLAGGLLPNLEVLCLANSGLSDGSIGGLVKALEKAPNQLRVLDLADNEPLSGAGVRALANALATCTLRVREEVKASGPAVSPEAAEALASAHKEGKAADKAERAAREAEKAAAAAKEQA